MEHGTYYSYLLRVWQVLRDDEFVWLASLDDPHTGERRSFKSMEELFAFLSQHVDEALQPARSQMERQNDPGVLYTKGEQRDEEIHETKRKGNFERWRDSTVQEEQTHEET